MVSTVKKLALVLLAFTFVCFFHGIAREEEDELLFPRGLTNQEDIDNLLIGAGGNVTQYKENQKPVIHTFFEPFRSTENDPMIDTWKEEWEKSGWKTKVLTLDDAKKHPNFEAMEKVVTEVFPTDIYNQLCFYRYLAMAMNGGGWMSDYDTFPTNFPMEEGNTMPNEGQFTSFQAHVPALISASADEWSRIASLMIERLPNADADFKSDMYVLKEIGEDEANGIIFLRPCYNVHFMIPYKEKGIIDCDQMKVGRAVHISHYSEALLKETDTYPVEAMENIPNENRRSSLASMFLDAWREQCGGSNAVAIQ